MLPTLAEPLFDEFVALTAQVFKLSISLISVVDADEVVCPASHGMPGNDRQPRAEALCATAIEKAYAVVYLAHGLLFNNTHLQLLPVGRGRALRKPPELPEKVR